MQEDNFYRKVTPEQRPVEQKAVEDKTSQEVKDQYSIICSAIERLKADVVFYDTNNGIPSEVLLNPTEFMHTVASNKKTVASINREISILEGLIDEYIKR